MNTFKPPHDIYEMIGYSQRHDRSKPGIIVCSIAWELAYSWIAVADTNGFALSEDSRKQMNSMWLPTTQGPTLYFALLAIRRSLLYFALYRSTEQLCEVCSENYTVCAGLVDLLLSFQQ